MVQPGHLGELPAVHGSVEMIDGQGDFEGSRGTGRVHGGEDLLQRAAQPLHDLLGRDAVAGLLLVQRLVHVLAVVDTDPPVEAGGAGVADRLQLDDDDGGPVAGPRIANDDPVLPVGCALMDESGRQRRLGDHGVHDARHVLQPPGHPVGERDGVAAAAALVLDDQLEIVERGDGGDGLPRLVQQAVSVAPDARQQLAGRRGDSAAGLLGEFDDGTDCGRRVHAREQAQRLSPVAGAPLVAAGVHTGARKLVLALDPVVARDLRGLTVPAVVRGHEGLVRGAEAAQCGGCDGHAAVPATAPGLEDADDSAGVGVEHR